MKTTEIKDLTVADLIERIEAEKANLNRMKLNHAVSPVENPAVLRNARRNIARMLTILREKQTIKQ